ncbi:hypothetical protein JX265_007310 [Neoarthrinium moseri]|uniref:Uncharacterized protein n=1 Tax=Neoarthrinium moseri TaxID=1658444 RepID=A0A9P9WK52_9PEZI|nr:hypothetical protein JX266_003650 [Neoarthrinium moseri]KAI1867508.1 hypothetical protein JX265_007310 [Neoarthrinium moseri]
MQLLSGLFLVAEAGFQKRWALALELTGKTGFRNVQKDPILITRSELAIGSIEISGARGQAGPSPGKADNSRQFPG